ncbi:S-methyl-5-thioribose kinase [Parasalinivibrio latis]|uniref:S-methyl-5-thioribose kinase n=1 Tax=Parasalinivibrio latis TaxID=2952610 RepID=UPI0030E2E8DB
MNISTPDGYYPLTVASLAQYLANTLPKSLSLQGRPDEWEISEVGDGNLNLVFIVQAPEKTLVVKQALPYVRAAGESWALSLSRSYFEYNILVEERKHTRPELVPEVFFYDEAMSLFIMEYLHPHIILRKGLMAGIEYPKLAEHIGVFLAETLFHTSDIGMEASAKKDLVSRYAKNQELCKITEDLIFTEPYFNAERNDWTSPELDEAVHSVWQDSELIQVAMQYKLKFMTEHQALLHGDLHSGSIMVTADETKVIDPEFGFMGPIAFDTGNYVGNLYMAFFSQFGLETDMDKRAAYQQWILDKIEETWTVFVTRFCDLWDNKQQGEAYPVEIYHSADRSLLRNAQNLFFESLFVDTLVNAGMEINRRIIGFAGVADFKSIEDPQVRAQCEAPALALAREIMINPNSYRNFRDVNQKATLLFKGI